MKIIIFKNLHLLPPTCKTPYEVITQVEVYKSSCATLGNTSPQVASCVRKNNELVWGTDSRQYLTPRFPFIDIEEPYPDERRNRAPGNPGSRERTHLEIRSEGGKGANGGGS